MDHNQKRGVVVKGDVGKKLLGQKPSRKGQIKKWGINGVEGRKKK